MDYINIETSIRFLQAENKAAIPQTGDLGLCILLSIIAFTLLMGSLLFVFKLKKITFSQGKSSVKTLSKGFTFLFIVVAILISIIGVVSIFAFGNEYAIAENEIIAPDTINAYVNEEGDISIEDANIYSKSGLDLKFDGTQTELCDSVLSLGESKWNISIDDNLIYNNNIPGNSETVVTAKATSKLSISAIGLSGDIAKSLIGKNVFKIKFKVKELQKIDVQFDPDNGQAKWIVQVNEESAVEKPKDNPEKHLSEFVSWQKDGNDYNFDLPVTESFTLKATWKDFEAIDYPIWKTNFEYCDKTFNVDNEVLWTNYDKEKIDISGETESANAGDHTVCFNVKHGYYWKESELDPYELCWGINKKNVSFSGGSSEKEYTGEQIIINDFAASGLVEGHSSNVSYTAQGREAGVYPGVITSVDNILIYDSEDNDKTANYSISTSVGSLTITPTDQQWNISMQDYVAEYNGAAQYNNNPLVSTAKSGSTVAKFSFSEDSGFVDDITELSVRDVTENAKPIYIIATNANYFKEVKATTSIKINKTDIKFYAEDRSLEYTGFAQYGFDLLTEGLISGHTSNVNYSIPSATDVTGTEGVSGTITPLEEIIIKDSNGNIVTNNYNLSTQTGKLIIMPSQSNWKIFLNDYETVYQDKPLYNTNLPLSRAAGGTTVFKYSFDQQNWKSNLSDLTQIESNPEGYVIYVQASNTNYEKLATTQSKLKILKRPIIFEGESVTIEDPTSDFETSTIIIDGLIVGHTHNVQYYAKVTADQPAGTYPGKITNKENVKIFNSNKEVTNNYDVSVKTGAITIISQTEFSISLNNYSCFYDGTPKYNHNIAKSTAKRGTTTFKYKFSDEGEDAWCDHLYELKKTDANEEGYVIDVKGTNENYDETEKTCTAKLIIFKATRQVSLSKSSLKDLIYDGGDGNCLKNSTTTQIISPTFDPSKDSVEIKKYNPDQESAVGYDLADDGTITIWAIKACEQNELYRVVLNGVNYKECSCTFQVSMTPFSFYRNSPESDNVTVKKYIGINNHTELVEVPDVIQAFDNDSNEGEQKTFVVSEVGDGVNPIFEDNGPYCEKLAFGSGVKYFNDMCFFSCTHLVGIQSATNTTWIGELAFFNCTNLKFCGWDIESTMDFPRHLEYIGTHAFANCTEITSVYFGACEKTFSIGEGAFAECEKLEHLYLNNAGVCIPSSAFDNTKITADKKSPIVYDSFSPPRGILKTNNTLDYDTVEIPSSVATIAESAFENCGTIKKIITQNSHMYINNYAFSECSSLEILVNRNSESNIVYGKDGINNNVLHGCGKFNDGRDLIIAGDVTNLPQADTDTNALYFQYTSSSITSHNKVLDDGNYYELQDNVIVNGGEISTPKSSGSDPTKCVVDLNGYAIDGQWSSGLFNVVETSKLWVVNSAKQRGGVLKNGINDSGTAKAGAFYVEGESLKISDCDIVNCRTKSDGGAIYVKNEDEDKTPLFYANNVKFDFCIAKDNNEYVGGGAIRLKRADGQIKNCSFENCSALEGGAIRFTKNCSLNVESSTFKNCFARNGGGGGAICIYSSSDVDNIYITDCEFTECFSTDNAGGAIYNAETARIRITRCKFHDNWDLKDWHYPRGSEKEEDLKGSLFSKHGRELLILTDCEGQQGIHTSSDW